MTKNYKTIKNLLLLSTLSIFCYSSASTMEVDLDKMEVDSNQQKINTPLKRKFKQEGPKSKEKKPKKQCCEEVILPNTESQTFLPKDFLDNQKDGDFEQLDNGLSVIECLAPTETSASEMEEDAPLKQPDSRLSFFEYLALREKSAFGEEYLPLEMIDYVISFLDLSKDQNTLLALSITNTNLHELVENIYTAANKHENHRPWQVSLSLPKSLPSTLYILNTRLRTILGLFDNIKLNLANNMDRIRFERLCSLFIINPLFLKHTLPAIYVDFLQLHLGITDPTPFQEPFVKDWENLLPEKRQICSHVLSTIVSQQNFEFQNEGALYFHYCQFVANMIPGNLAKLHSTPLFKELNNSFMGLMNKELSDLKATPDLSNEGNFAPTWEKILALEPVITIEQYYLAASSLGKAGKAATEPDIKYKSFTKAYEYREKQLEAIKGTRQTPTAISYANIATAYFNAGVWATERDIKFKSFTKAYEYHEKKLEAMKAEGRAPTASNYIDIAQAYHNAADAGAEPDIKFKSLTKAYEYYEKKLEAMKAEGQAPKASHYSDIAYAYHKAGLCATDQDIKFKSFTKASEYFEKKLEAMKAEGRAPTADHYGITAISYSNAGAAATDNNVKLENFTKAKALFEICLNMELTLNEVKITNHHLNEINTYLNEYKKTEFDTTFNKQPLGG